MTEPADHEDWREIIAPGAFDAHLPATVPVRGPDGEIITTAEVTADEHGIAFTMRLPEQP